MKLQPYQQRVVDEGYDLGVKLCALNAFICTPAFKLVNLLEQDRMWRQRLHMQAYYDTIVQRVVAWTL